MTASTDAPTPPPIFDRRDVSASDWAFCWEHLVEVSRTFSKPIRLLPAKLRAAATCGYLLCRIADTIEDHPDLAFERKRELFELFLDAVEDGASGEEFALAFQEVPGSGAYHDLARRLPRVLAVYRALPEPIVRTTERRVGEMSRGMLNYERRREWSGDVAGVETLRDLERYCYYVAGTVGHMLTDLFLEELESVEDSAHHRLRATAEDFGLGLQMVNILKDQTDDFEEGWCFIPRLALRREGLEVDDLFDPEHREAAHRAVAPIFDRTREHLDAALEYVLALPEHARAIRIACLVPLWLAVRTLVHARGNDAMFEPGAPVKIDRDEVARLTAQCADHARDDFALRSHYDDLWAPG